MRQPIGKRRRVPHFRQSGILPHERLERQEHLAPEKATVRLCGTRTILPDSSIIESHVRWTRQEQSGQQEIDMQHMATWAEHVVHSPSQMQRHWTDCAHVLHASNSPRLMTTPLRGFRMPCSLQSRSTKIVWLPHSGACVESSGGTPKRTATIPRSWERPAVSPCLSKVQDRSTEPIICEG
jgi:hypothetical protein